MNTNQSSSYCTFIVGWSLCGVRVDLVREVVSELACTPVPLSDRSISGLINLRGQIVTVVDTSVCIGANENAMETKPTNHVIVDVGDERMSLLVDDIGPVIEIENERIEPTPTNLKQSIPNFISETARVSEGIVLLLDVNRLAQLRHGSTS
ncbi:MAG: chemotaxis protein CheW [Rubripirellula sp.]